jgi:hypothetical protein
MLKNRTSAPSASILFTSERFGFDSFTRFGKNSAVTDFAVFEINFDDVKVKHLRFLVFEAKNKTTSKITVVGGFSTQLLSSSILEKLF